MNSLYGIDYGSKRAGTTVVAFLAENGKSVEFAASAKKQDADAFLLRFFAERPPGFIFLDAPLSLPEVYHGILPVNGSEPDFFYRPCDRELGAMSPLFLGGLTARAMRLAFHLRKQGWVVQETYPGALAQHLGIKSHGYKESKNALPACTHVLKAEFPQLDTSAELPDWHHFDAWLALCSALRHSSGKAIKIGEGQSASIII